MFSNIILIALLFLPFTFSTSFHLEFQLEDEDLPLPHIIIIGATGAGKSSLANVFIGEDPTCENCTFPVCSGADSCTKDTTFAVRPWLGSGQVFTVVDTPGFGDSDKEDSVLIDEMMSVLKGTIKSGSALLLVLDGNQDRFSESLQQMLREMRALFGDQMWDNILIGVSKWAYDQSSIDQRNKTCIFTPKQCRDEAAFSSSMMNAIEEKFHVGKNLTFAFIDSWAKHPMNLGDQGQQQAFERESSILWDFALNSQEFAFKSIEDVLEENEELKIEVSYLKGVLENNITEILRIIEEQGIDLTRLTIEHGKTAETVAELEVAKTELENRTQSNSEQISLHENAIQSQGILIEDNSNQILLHSDAIEAIMLSVESLKLTIEQLESLPLGTIIAWNQLDVDSHTPNWVECDGRPILEGPWKDKHTPDINNSKRFLRGGTLAEAFEIQEDAFQEHHHEHTHSYTDDQPYSKEGADPEDDTYMYNVNKVVTRETGSAKHGRIVASDKSTLARIADETRPKNIKVVYLMKCWHL